MSPVRLTMRRMATDSSPGRTWISQHMGTPYDRSTTSCGRLRSGSTKIPAMGKGGPSETRSQERHRSERIGWLRAAVLGANDGIVSTASLVIGIAAAQSSRQQVLVAGVAGL